MASFSRKRTALSEYSASRFPILFTHSCRLVHHIYRCLLYFLEDRRKVFIVIEFIQGPRPLRGFWRDVLLELVFGKWHAFCCWRNVLLELAFRKWRAILAGSVYSVELAENMQEIPDYNQTNKTWKVFHHTEPILAQITTSLDPTKQTRLTPFSPDAALTMFLSINPAVYIQTWRQFTIRGASLRY